MCLSECLGLGRDVGTTCCLSCSHHTGPDSQLISDSWIFEVPQGGPDLSLYLDIIIWGLVVKEAKESSLSLSSRNCRPTRGSAGGSWGQPSSLLCAYVHLFLCEVYWWTGLSWQATSKPGLALPAALAWKAVNGLFVPCYRKTEQNQKVQQTAHITMSRELLSAN